MANERIVFFGGTFDPVHVGHIKMATTAIQSGTIDRLYFIPTAQNPLKPNAPLESNEARLALLKAAIQGQSNMDVLDIEFHLPQPSYTYQTVNQLKDTFPGATLFWLIGSDQLHQLESWYAIDKLAEEIRFLLVARELEFTVPPIKGLNIFPLQNPIVPVSSTQIRDSLVRGVVPDDLLPHPVAKIIRDRGYYGITE